MSVTTITAGGARGGFTAESFTADRSSTSTVGARDTTSGVGIWDYHTRTGATGDAAAPAQPRRQSPRQQPKPRGNRSRRRATGLGPLARPLRAVPAPSLRAPAYPTAQVGTVGEGPASWQLTDRGVAVVTIAVLMIVVAALAVVGLTAIRVTGDHYQAPSGVQATHS